MTTESSMIAFLDKQEKRLKELEDRIAGNDPKPKEKPDEVAEFIELMKAINKTDSAGEGDGNDFTFGL